MNYIHQQNINNSSLLMNQQPFNMNFGSFDMTSTPLEQQIPMDQIPYADWFLTEERVEAQQNNSTAPTEATGSSDNTSVAARKPHVPKCIDKTKTLLPMEFQPSDNSIICGNKRKYFNSTGNARLRELVKSFIPEFSQADGKLEKGVIVSKVMNIVRDLCPVGAFVTMENGRWWQVSERTSREKVGSLFRDFCSNKYKSSAQNKIARRKSKREEKKQQRRSSSVSSASATVAQPLSSMPENVASLPTLHSVAQAPSYTDDQEEENSIASSQSCSFYDVDDLTNVQMEEL